LAVGGLHHLEQVFATDGDGDVDGGLLGGHLDPGQGLLEEAGQGPEGRPGGGGLLTGLLGHA